MPPQEPYTQQPAPVTPLRVGKFKASSMLVEQSWALLKQDKEILWFPVLSTVTSIIALTLMAVLFFFTVMGGDVHALEGETEQAMGFLDYSMLILFYTVMFFIANFFQAGIYIIAYGRMNGRDLTFSDGIQGATNAAGKIFLWSLISATVGVVLRAIADRSKLVGRIVVALLGAAWNILTYFSLPALVISNVSVVDSFKVSAATIRKTWGETLILNIGMGLFFFSIASIGIALGIGIIMLAPMASIALSVFILLVVYIVALSIVSSTLGAIFKLALYQYAQTGIVPEGFSPELIQNAVKR